MYNILKITLLIYLSGCVAAYMTGSRLTKRNTGYWSNEERKGSAVLSLLSWIIVIALILVYGFKGIIILAKYVGIDKPILYILEGKPIEQIHKEQTDRKNKPLDLLENSLKEN